MIPILLTKSYIEYFKLQENYSEFDAVDNINSVGNGFYNILLMLSAFGLVIGFLLICADLMLGDSKKRSESKRELSGRLILGIVLFAIGAIVQLAYDIGSSFVF